MAGCDLVGDPAGVRARIGHVAQHSGAGDEQRVGEELVLQGRLHRLSTAEARRRAAALLERLDLVGTERRAVATLSGGQRRRLDIAMGVLHRPRLVFLDEPSSGLDPQSRRNLWDHVRTLREEGTTVFLTTHHLDEADALCDRVLVIDHGRIVAEGAPEELKRAVSGDLVTLGAARPELLLPVVRRLPGAREAVVSDSRLSFRVPGGDALLPDLLRHVDGAGVTLDSVRVQRPTLDDVFLTLTGRSLREDDRAA